VEKPDEIAAYRRIRGLLAEAALDEGETTRRHLPGELSRCCPTARETGSSRAIAEYWIEHKLPRALNLAFSRLSVVTGTLIATLSPLNAGQGGGRVGRTGGSVV
jgi:hypothetical protein